MRWRRETATDAARRIPRRSECRPAFPCPPDRRRRWRRAERTAATGVILMALNAPALVKSASRALARCRDPGSFTLASECRDRAQTAMSARQRPEPERPPPDHRRTRPDAARVLVTIRNPGFPGRGERAAGFSRALPAAPAPCGGGGAGRVHAMARPSIEPASGGGGQGRAARRALLPSARQSRLLSATARRKVRQPS